MGAFDIIVPCYKAEKTISETLTSIICQTFSDFSVFVIIDGYNENLINIINNTVNNDIRFKLIVIEENQGVAFARNLGLSYCKSDWIAFCDADDIWLPRKLEEQFNFISSKENQQLKIISCTCKNIGYESKNYKKYLILNNVFKILKTYNPFCFSSLIIKRDLIKNYYFKNIIHEDYQFLIDITKNESISAAILENGLVYYRRSNFSRSGNIFYSIKHNLKIKIANFGYTRMLLTFPSYIILSFRKRFLI